jgi:beta-glucosidase
LIPGIDLGSVLHTIYLLTHHSPSLGALGRHALGGRNWEGFSPDPYLTGVAAGLTVQGLQSNGVQACAKHFIANEQETQRTNTTHQDGSLVNAISSNVDDRTLHELYLWPFYDTVKAGTASVMCSYQRFNQTYACENPALLNGILKEELGFRGYVMSDWFATHSASNAANAGLDLEMPGEMPDLAELPPQPQFFGRLLAEAVANGTLTIDRLDDMIVRIMTSYYVLNQDTPDYPAVDPSIQSLLAVTNYGLGPAKKVLEQYGIP